jgi:hypothetical protein
MTVPPGSRGRPTTAKRPRRRTAFGVSLIGLALTAAAWFWFQPHKLFLDERVDEALPSLGAPSTPDGPGGGEPAAIAATPPAASVPPVLAGGRFVSLDHGTSGTVEVLALGGGARVVRLEDLDTSNGPDLFVYLSTNPTGGPEGAFDDDYVNLGRLKGNQGDQNYSLPADVDLKRFASVVIWCDRFDSAFGAADLAAA